MVSGDRAFPTGTVTMLFTDVEGSTRLLKQLGERYGGMLAEHRRLLRGAVAAHGGREMDTQGDAFFVAFPRARNAVDAAVEAQRALAAQAWPDGVECRVRMGLHTGEPAVGEEGYHGMGVHRGARICAAGARRADPALQYHPRTGRGRAACGCRAARPRRAVAQGHRPSRADLPAPRRRAPVGVPAAPDRAAPGVGRDCCPPPPAAGCPGRGRAGRPGGCDGDDRADHRRRLEAGGAAGEVSADSVGIFRSRQRAPRWARSRSVRRRAASPPASARSGSRTSTHTACHGSIPSSASRFRRSRSETVPPGSRSAAASCGWRTGRTGRSRRSIRRRTPSSTIGVGNGPSAVAADAHGVWVANADDGTLTQIDPRTGKVLRRRIPVGQSADGVAVGFGSVWVTSEVDRERHPDRRAVAADSPRPSKPGVARMPWLSGGTRCGSQTTSRHRHAHRSRHQHHPRHDPGR